MDSSLEIMMILLVLSDMALLGMSRLRTCIGIVSFQGMLLGLFTLAMHYNTLSLRLIIIAAASFIIKGFVFPNLLRRGIREAGTQHEIEPFVGYIMSVVIGIVMLGVSFWMADKAPSIYGHKRLYLIVPAA